MPTANTMQFEIHWADLNPVIGREQAGKRPVLIVSNDIENRLDVITVIPFTSRKPGRTVYPNEVLMTLQNQEAILLCHQIRTLSKARLSGKIAQVSDPALKRQIYNTLCLRFAQV